MSDFALLNAISQRIWPPKRPHTRANLKAACAGENARHLETHICVYMRTLACRCSGAAATAVLLGISKLRQKSTLVFRAKAPRLRTHARQSSAHPHTHNSSSRNHVQKVSNESQHASIGISTGVTGTGDCSTGYSASWSSPVGTAVVAESLFNHQPS